MVFQNRCVTGKNIAGSKPMADLHTKKKVYFNNLEKKNTINQKNLEDKLYFPTVPVLILS